MTARMVDVHLMVGDADDEEAARQTARACAAISARIDGSPEMARAKLALEALATALKSCDPVPTDDQVNAVLELINEEIAAAKVR